MLSTEERSFFHWADWTVFGSMLLISAGAGIWHFKKAQKSNTEDYLLGGKGMNIFPVTASLIAR